VTTAPVIDVQVATERGRRVLHVTLDVDERVAAVVRLHRDKRRLARERTLGLGPGRHDLDLPLRRLAGRGPAQLTVALASPAGSARTVQRMDVSLTPSPAT
jgi:hypothetical protein